MLTQSFSKESKTVAVFAISKPHAASVTMGHQRPAKESAGQ